jgi:hypothetical protein
MLYKLKLICDEFGFFYLKEDMCVAAWENQSQNLRYGVIYNYNNWKLMN